MSLGTSASSNPNRLFSSFYTTGHGPPVRVPGRVSGPDWELGLGIVTRVVPQTFPYLSTSRSTPVASPMTRYDVGPEGFQVRQKSETDRSSCVTTQGQVILHITMIKQLLVFHELPHFQITNKDYSSKFQQEYHCRRNENGREFERITRSSS